MNVETTYPAEVAMVKRIIDLANRAEIETPVVDPAERAKLASEKLVLESRNKAVDQEITNQRLLMQNAIEQVAPKALVAGVPLHKVNQYKQIALKGNDLTPATVLPCYHSSRSYSKRNFSGSEGSSISLGKNNS